MTERSEWFLKNLAKVQRYCAYQDRCHQEVRTKLIKLKVYGQALEEMISILVQEGFLNEERYARSYVRGKFRIKKWGRVKIEQRLKMKNISAYSIRKGMSEIDEDEYKQTLAAIVEQEVGKLESPINKIKLTKKMMLKGYETGLVMEVLKKY